MTTTTPPSSTLPADEHDPYTAIALDPVNEIGISGALITMVEPDVGAEVAYNRWYEDDHFFSGAMVGPWVFSGRRWVATRDLQLLRFPEDSPVAQPVTAGCYISTYWWARGHYEDTARWSTQAMKDNLYLKGRGFEDRQHIYTSNSVFEFSQTRPDLTRLQPEHAFLHPFAGMVVEVVDVAEGTDRQALIAALRDTVLPAELEAPLAMVVAFTPQAKGSSGPVPRVPGPYGPGRVLTLLWFLQADPRTCWSRFPTHTEKYAAVGGQLVFAAPFVPTIVGTDTYVDQLR
jgi:hypothetical protein